MPATDSLQVRWESYKGWDAWRLQRGPLALLIVPQVGGRIMGLQWRERELSFVNPDCQGRVQDVTAIADVRQCKRLLGFLLWGGDKTWLAPQSRWTDEVPFIDLDSGAYEIACDERAGSAAMISPLCRETGVQIERTVVLGEEIGHWSVKHTLRNRSEQPVTWGPWDVAMMLRPATVFLLTREDSAFPQGLRTFENEGVSARVRDQVVEFADGLAAISCRDPIRFKYGTDAMVGSILAIMETGSSELIGYRKSVPSYHPMPYASDCVVEVFNADAHS